MIGDGLFEQFPCDEIYGLHNAPDLEPNQVASFGGPAMAGADFFDIAIRGHGSHGAMPNSARDPIVIAMTIGQALQTIVSRNVNPHEAAVVDYQMHSGSAYNIIPDEQAKLCGTMRGFSDQARALMRDRMRAISAGLAASFAVEIDVDIQLLRCWSTASLSRANCRRCRARGGWVGECFDHAAAKDGQRGFRRYAACRSGSSGWGTRA